MTAHPPFSERRTRLQAALPGGLLLFLGNEESPMNYRDNAYPFRQDSSFLYFTGIERPGAALLLDLDEGRTTLFADDPTLDDIVWTGPQPPVRDLAARAGIPFAEPAAHLQDRLARAVAGGRPVHFLPPYRAEHRLRLQEALGIPPAEQDRAASLPLVQAVAELRIRKSPWEEAELEKAVATSVRMHEAAMRQVRPGMTEAQVLARVTEIALAEGGGLSFPVIATVHGGVLHNTTYGATLEPGQCFLLDAGAETPTRYAGDLSSSFPVDRRFTSRQRDVYAVVLRAFLAAVEALRPGLDFRDAHLLACRVLASGLKDLGLMRGDVDEAVAQGAHALFFPCGLGHLMGLDVHDMENLGERWVGYQGREKSTAFGLKSLRLGRKLEERFVLTVEPGIYFMAELTDRWRAEGRFRDFIDYAALASWRDFGGMRIEEDFIITEGGSRRLGPPKPRTAEEVEALRS